MTLIDADNEKKRKELQEDVDLLLDPERIAAYGKTVKEREIINWYVRDWVRSRNILAVFGGERGGESD